MLPPDLIQKAVDSINYFLAAILLTIVLTVVQKSWAGWVKIALIFLWTMICWYIFSWAIQYFFPYIYGAGKVFGDAFSSIVPFLFLVWAIQHDVYEQAFDAVRNVATKSKSK